jgi:hypothetical protein
MAKNIEQVSQIGKREVPDAMTRLWLEARRR